MKDIFVSTACGASNQGLRKKSFPRKDSVLHAGGNCMQRIVTQMSVALGCLALRMSKRLADQEQTDAVRRREGCERMAEVVKSKVRQFSFDSHTSPNFLQILHRAITLFGWKDVHS